MDKFIINGGRSLNGSIDIATSKNAILPILAGSIICDDGVVLNKITRYSDVDNMLEILKSLGATFRFQDDDLSIDLSQVTKFSISEDLTKKVRSSIFLLGPLLARFGKAKVAYPGGCNIGNRPIDLHLKGLKALGVKINEEHGFILCEGDKMKASDIHLDFPSVGATENLMMASVKLKGTTTIHNCAREPEIIDLQNFLNSMGAKIVGAGTSTIIINGVNEFRGTMFTPISDRIIAGTYMIACAMCGGHIQLNNCIIEHNIALIEKLKQSNINIKTYGNIVEIESNRKIDACKIIETSPFPGFATDMQNQILAMQTISKGTSVIIENMFENRFKICNELKKMGADIVIKDRIALVQGVNELSGASIKASDLRCGAGLVLAGMVAKGYTTIEDIFHIDRGYKNIENDLNYLGADIVRIKDKMN